MEEFLVMCVHVGSLMASEKNFSWIFQFPIMINIITHYTKITRESVEEKKKWEIVKYASRFDADAEGNCMRRCCICFVSNFSWCDAYFFHSLHFIDRWWDVDINDSAYFYFNFFFRFFFVAFSWVHEFCVMMRNTWE